MENKILHSGDIPNLVKWTSGKVLWSGVMGSSSTSKFNLKDSVANYKRIALVYQISNWAPSQDKPGYLYEVYNNGNGFNHMPNIAYAWEDGTYVIYTGMVQIGNNGELNWFNARSRSITINADGSILNEKDNDGKICLTKVIGYK